jgi:serine-type D-Ala-D-Ala carboxypeptidase (penicillin-binding protein 5/6)
MSSLRIYSMLIGGIYSLWSGVTPCVATQYIIPDPPIQEPILLSSFFPPVTPIKNKHSLGPILSAKSVIALDIDSGVILFEKNIYERLPIASITKIMTALIVLEYIKDLSQSVTIPRQVITIEPSKMNLLPGDILSVRQLLLGALIHSANDAAFVLSTLIPDFIVLMNQKATELHLYDSHFSNTIGWDEDNNFSSAYDLSKMMIFAIQKPLIYEAISTRETNVVSQKGKTYTLKTTNKLFESFLDEIGGKTGTTDNAGPSLLNIFRTPNKHRILTVVLNSSDRYTETKVLSYWIIQNFEWK